MIKYLEKQEFFDRTKELEGGHWTPETIEIRWDYHFRVVELLKSLKLNSPQEVLEMGTMGVTCVKNCDTIDYEESWDFDGKSPTYIHDARELPWPIEDKKYEVFIALRVYQHLTPKQFECVKEAFRISKKVIIVVPETYNNTVIPDSKGITYKNFLEYLEGVHPNLLIPTAFGNLYYWDSDNPGNINLEQVMSNLKINSNIIKVAKKNKPKHKSYIKRIIKKIKNKIRPLIK